MTSDPTRLEVLVSLAGPIETTAIVGALANRGIRATAVGGWTSQFQTGVPGDVKIMVLRADLARAREALVDIRCEFTDLDWSAVDIPDDEPT